MRRGYSYPRNVGVESKLISAKGVDYRKLDRLLASGKWQEADQETAKKMLEAAGRTKDGWLRVEGIDRFPCEDLRTIDQLWVKYSNGRFGFSVQKRIYESLGGTREYNKKIWEAFGDRVGWRRVTGIWVYYNDLKFNTTAPAGHLPGVLLLWVWGGIGGGVGEGGEGALFSRVETCKV